MAECRLYAELRAALGRRGVDPGSLPPESAIVIRAIAGPDFSFQAELQFQDKDFAAKGANAALAQLRLIEAIRAHVSTLPKAKPVGKRRKKARNRSGRDGMTSASSAASATSSTGTNAAADGQRSVYLMRHASPSTVCATLRNLKSILGAVTTFDVIPESFGETVWAEIGDVGGLIACLAAQKEPMSLEVYAEVELKVDILLGLIELARHHIQDERPLKAVQFLALLGGAARPLSSASSASGDQGTDSHGAHGVPVPSRQAVEFPSAAGGPRAPRSAEEQAQFRRAVPGLVAAASDALKAIPEDDRRGDGGGLRNPTGQSCYANAAIRMLHSVADDALLCPDVLASTLSPGASSGQADVAVYFSALAGVLSDPAQSFAVDAAPLLALLRLLGNGGELPVEAVGDSYACFSALVTSLAAALPAFCSRFSTEVVEEAKCGDCGWVVLSRVPGFGIQLHGEPDTPTTVQVTAPALSALQRICALAGGPGPLAGDRRHSHAAPLPPGDSELRTQDHFVSASPDVLACWFSPYIYNSENERSEKLTYLLTLNSRPIDMSAFTRRDKDVYRLHAVVIHSGSQADDGHFACVVGESDGTWSNYSDSTVARGRHKDGDVVGAVYGFCLARMAEANYSPSSVRGDAPSPSSSRPFRDAYPESVRPADQGPAPPSQRQNVPAFRLPASTRSAPSTQDTSISGADDASSRSDATESTQGLSASSAPAAHIQRAQQNWRYYIFGEGAAESPPKEPSFPDSGRESSALESFHSSEFASAHSSRLEESSDPLAQVLASDESGGSQPASPPFPTLLVPGLHGGQSIAFASLGLPTPPGTAAEGSATNGEPMEH